MVTETCACARLQPATKIVNPKIAIPRCFNVRIILPCLLDKGSLFMFQAGSRESIPG